MAHKAQREFCDSVRNKYSDMFKGKKVLDIGSLDNNGNNRFLFDDCEYLGIDLCSHYQSIFRFVYLA